MLVGTIILCVHSNTSNTSLRVHMAFYPKPFSVMWKSPSINENDQAENITLPACMHACMPTSLPTCLPTCMQAYMHAYMPTWLPACLPACLYSCMYIYFFSIKNKE